MKYYAPSPRTLSVVLSLLMLAGCSSNKKRFVVEGLVSYRGQPLSSGRIWIYMADGQASMAEIRNGAFTVTDVFPGEAKAAVKATGGISSARMRMRKAKPKDKGAAPLTPPEQRAATQSVSLPDKYKNANTSGLLLTLVPGQPLEIQLE